MVQLMTGIKTFRKRMYQVDSWYAVLFELLIVGLTFYNSLRLTKWWGTVKEGARIGVRGSSRAPSVADYFGICSDSKMELRACEKTPAGTPRVAEMGDGMGTH
uniref:Uncharacterized protein n=3 Tax=Caenorhabditis japonica TaxID=281687 RepID=A0A8R1EIP4_CAEJA